MDKISEKPIATSDQQKEKSSRNLCIIPARGGSKRIPRKNIKDFCGKPILAYSIEAALASQLFDMVMVSTDDEEIRQVAIQYGAEVPFLRSEDNANDMATTAAVLEEVLNRYKNLGKEFFNACCLYPTAPFVTGDKLQEGYAKLNASDADAVFPVVKFEYPVWRGLRMHDNHHVEMFWKEHLNSRSQDLETVFHDAGQWYWFRIDRFLQSKKIFTENTLGVELSPLEVQDIDTTHDWHLAELKYGYLQSLK
jgi:pseudaminic acid cytidylyltransferase